jgi:type I restriction enzyme R subunit
MSNEADTCRRYVVPLLQAAGWDTEPHRINEQVTFTDGRIILAGKRVQRGKQKRADYILRYARDLPLAVVEAKAKYKLPGDGLQQAKDYAEVLDLKFAYATNGEGIVEFDYLTGIERELAAYSTPQELWERLYGDQPLTAQAPVAHPAQPPGVASSIFWRRLRRTRMRPKRAEMVRAKS